MIGLQLLLKVRRQRMRGQILAFVVFVMSAGGRAFAQGPPPKIGPFALDLHLIVPKFGDDPQLAGSRGLTQAELPGAGLGGSAAAHVYLPKIAGITLGLGVEAMIGRSSASPQTTSTSPTRLRPVTEVFKGFSPQLSLNFGNGNGWSYLSVGIGRSVWSVVPESRAPLDVDEEPIRTISYGGGARWFAKKRLAFSLDVRVYEVDGGRPSLELPSTPQSGPPGSPRTLLLVVGAGISVR